METKVTEKNLVDYIICYEEGGLEFYECLELFSYLIKTGNAWTLQGHYGRTAVNLIQNSFLSECGEINELAVEEYYLYND